MTGEGTYVGRAQGMTLESLEIAALLTEVTVVGLASMYLT
jgi:hypothetical protein